MRQSLHYLTADSLAFPSPHLALNDPNGLLAVGGDLSPQRLISAYSQAIFPWFNEDDPLMWWSPTPRAVIPVNEIKVNRTLSKFIKKSSYQVTLNHAFDQVIAQCAQAPFRNEDTWIVKEMQLAYQRLHQLGYAHSIEVWADGKLVGGLYGVAINGFFSGESMFYQLTNASKVALISLATLLKSANIELIDCQIINPFLKDMGAIEINRKTFMKSQQQAIIQKLPIDFWQKKSLPIQ